MQKQIERAQIAGCPANFATLRKGAAVGSVAGLAGTVVMDLFCIVLILTLGGPASLSFSIIGDAAAAFLALAGVEVAGGVPLGVALHYLIGLVFGAVLGAAVAGSARFAVDSPMKSAGLGTVYAEGMSLPLLATAAIVLQMTPSETAEWFGASLVMHLLYGATLGAALGRGLRSATAIRDN